MRKLIASVPLVVIGIFILSATAFGGSAVPELSAWDQSRAEIDGAVEIDEGSSTALTTGRITRQGALATAAEWVDVSKGTRVYAGRAAQIAGEPARDVIVVVVAGGTFPLSGPAGEGLANRKARITGVILDATTGEFMSGFMLT